MDENYAKEILEKVKKDYCNIAENFSATRGREWEELNVLTEEYVRDGQMILDVGCGNGRLFSILKNKKIKYTGIDNCQKLLEIAKGKYKNYKNVEFYNKDLLSLSFKENEFDIIFAIASFHHIPTKKLRIDVLKGIYKTLKPGGYFIMLNWNLFQKDKIKYVKKYNKMIRDGKSDLEKNDTLIPWKESSSSYDKKHDKIEKEILRYYHAFTIDEITRLLKQADFKLKEIYYTKRGVMSDIDEGYNLCTVACKEK